MRKVENGRLHKLSLCKLTETALISIFDYLGPQNNKQSSIFLSTCSFLKEIVMVPKAGLEPATSGDITRLNPASPLFFQFFMLDILDF